MTKQQPKYALHKATGQARVRINGKSIYLGEYGSEESRRRYDEIVTEHMKATLNVSFHKLTIAQLCLAYVKHAKSYYVKNGRITSEVSNIQVALRPLVKLYGKGLVAEFGPSKLKQVRELMIENGIVRKSINRGVGRIKRMFRWGVENEMVSTNVLAAINAVPGIRYGRTTAMEADPIKPVPEEHISNALPCLECPIFLSATARKPKVSAVDSMNCGMPSHCQYVVHAHPERDCCKQTDDEHYCSSSTCRFDLPPHDKSGQSPEAERQSDRVHSQCP